MRTNTIKVIPLAFFGGIASATINIPFMVNEIRIICLTAAIPGDGVTRQLIITSNLLPNIDSPIGYLIGSMSLGVEFETSSSQSRLEYLFPSARPVSGNYTFNCLDFTNAFKSITFTASVFIEFIQN